MTESEPRREDIIIDLSKSQNADVFKGEGDSLLQQTALKQVKDIILKLPAKIEKHKNSPSTNNWALRRSHDVITINGERGSGKTTFILNILKLIPTWNEGSPIRCRIHNLGIIDPTLIEDREHIFLTVISIIRDEVDRHWENGRVDAESIDDRHEEWRTSLTKLARGLCNLREEKATDGDSWSDPQFIMAEGLDNATQGVKLERYFHNFVEKSLQLIDAEAFVIALDDVDTKVEAGWPVLEVLRKYLTTPRLIIILSGDIQLYTQLIFSMQCKQIGVNSGKITEIPEKYVVQRNLVNDLTEQYMMKIMRPDYRIEMQTVAQIAKQSNIKVKIDKDSKAQKLSVVLEDFCEKIYGSKFQLNHLAQVLTEVPTRTCIQILNTATDFRNKWKDATEKGDKKIIYMEAVAGLGHVFQNALARAGLSSKLVNEVDANHMTLGSLATALKKENLLKQGYHLFPIVEKPWQRQLMMVLGAVYTRSLSKQPAMIFGYQIYICLSAYLQGTLREEDFTEYIEISQLETEIEAINTVKRGTKFILEEAKNKEAKNKEANNKVTIAATFCLKKVDKEPVVTSWHHYLLNMASVFAEIDCSTERHISFTALLASIATLAGSVKEPEGTNTNNVDTVSVVNNMRQYGSADNIGFGDPGDPDRRPQDSIESQKYFAELFATWCWSLLEPSVLPLLALTESWSRFSSSTKHLSKRYSNGGGQKAQYGLGDYIQDCIILYLNHLLEYELIIMAAGTEFKIEPDDNQCIEKRFEGTLAKYVEHIKKDSHGNGRRCKIFDHVFSCPIWMHFINLNSGDNNVQSIVENYIYFLSEKTKGCDLEAMFKDCDLETMFKKLDPNSKMKKKAKSNYVDKMTNDQKMVEVVNNISNCMDKDKNMNLFAILNEN